MNDSPEKPLRIGIRACKIRSDQSGACSHRDVAVVLANFVKAPEKPSKQDLLRFVHAR